jgi:hypothetical protein
MDETKLEKYNYTDYAKYEHVSKSDLFFAEHFEELFYMSSKELAMAINAMDEDELLQFLLTIRDGYGINVDLIIEKLDELNKYLNVSGIFLEAKVRLSLLDFIDFHGRNYKDVFHDLFLAIVAIWDSEDELKVKKDMIVNTVPPKIIKDLIDAGQLEMNPTSNGKFKPLRTMPQFIQ